MAKKQPARQWGLAPRRPTKPPVPEKVRAEVKAAADELVEKILRPRYIKPPPKESEWNYPIDLWTKWQGNYFYISSTWACPGPNALSPTFETGLARLEYQGIDSYGLSYFRHTGKWFEIETGFTLKDCLEMIEAGGPFSLE